MHTHRILFVLTSAERMGNRPEPTGAWLEEFAAPYYAFLDARAQVTLASPKGGAVPIDPTSLQPENQTPSTRRYEADAKAQFALGHSLKLASVALAEYEAIFFPGGHGTMEDLPHDPAVRRAVEYFYRSAKPLAAVCHGPACLVRATKTNGQPLIAGHRFTCFTNAEETAVGLSEQVPFLLQSVLSEQGGIADIAPPFAAKLVRDGSLITGQNPASSIPAAEAVIHQLRRNEQAQAA